MVAGAALINAQITTVEVYADFLLASSAGESSETTVGIISSLLNVTPTNAQTELSCRLLRRRKSRTRLLKSDLTRPQISRPGNRARINLANATAIANFTQAAFPNTQAGDVNFVQTAAAQIYGLVNTPNLVNVMQQWVTNLEGLFLIPPMDFPAIEPRPQTRSIRRRAQPHLVMPLA